MDGTEALCQALYHRKEQASDYIGGGDAQMLHDAAKRIAELEAAINEAHQILGRAGETSFKKISLAADQAYSVLGQVLEMSDGPQGP